MKVGEDCGEETEVDLLLPCSRVTRSLKSKRLSHFMAEKGRHVGACLSSLVRVCCLCYSLGQLRAV